MEDLLILLLIATFAVLVVIPLLCVLLMFWVRYVGAILEWLGF